MDNLNDIISSLSSDDIEMLKGVASSIIGSNGNNQQQSPPQEQSQNNNNQNPLGNIGNLGNLGNIGSILGAMNSVDNATNAAASASNAASMLGGLNFSKQDFEMMMKAKTIFEKMNTANNKNVDLIMALRPHLSTKTQDKADQAMKILRLFEALPLLKDLF